MKEQEKNLANNDIFKNVIVRILKPFAQTWTVIFAYKKVIEDHTRFHFFEIEFSRLYTFL